MREVEWTGRVKNAVFFLNLCSDRNRRVLAVWRSMRICGRRPQSKEMFLLSEEGGGGGAHPNVVQGPEKNKRILRSTGRFNP